MLQEIHCIFFYPFHNLIGINEIATDFHGYIHRMNNKKYPNNIGRRVIFFTLNFHIGNSGKTTSCLRSRVADKNCIASHVM